MKEIKSICVFCGAQDTIEDKYKKLAYKIGEKIAERGITLIYGGAKAGVMRSLAKGASENGGEVVAVYPTFFHHRHVFESEVTKIIDVPDLAERKKIMIDMADAFLTLPGGFGTLDEVFEVLTGYTLYYDFQKPFILYNQDGYWDHLKAIINHAIKLRFVKPKSGLPIHYAESFEEIFKKIDKLRGE